MYVIRCYLQSTCTRVVSLKEGGQIPESITQPMCSAPDSPWHLASHLQIISIAFTYLSITSFTSQVSYQWNCISRSQITAQPSSSKQVWVSSTATKATILYQSCTSGLSFRASSTCSSPAALSGDLVCLELQQFLKNCIILSDILLSQPCQCYDSQQYKSCMENVVGNPP